VESGKAPVIGLVDFVPYNLKHFFTDIVYIIAQLHCKNDQNVKILQSSLHDT